MKKTTYRLAVVGLLLTFFLQAFLSMRQLSPSSDEFLYVSAGYTYLKTGEMRISTSHPPLMQELYALPLLFMDITESFDDPNWTSEEPNEFPYCHRFFYSNDVETIMFWARLIVICLAVLLGLYIHKWARELFGDAAGVLALFLFAFSPNLIAHSRFAVMDMGLSCFYFIAAYYFWKTVARRKKRDLILCGVFTGLALAAKFSAVFLFPAFFASLLVMVVMERSRKDRAPDPDAVTPLYAMTVLAVVTAVAGLVVWATYLFTTDPLFYYKGMRLVNENHNPNIPSYLMGEFRLGRFLHYFVAAFLFKTSETTLVLLLLSIVLYGKLARREPDASRSTSSRVWRELCLVLAPATIFVVTTFMANALGLRYILPIYAFLFVFVSRVAPAMMKSKLGRVAALALVAWYAGWTLHIYPFYVSYFNQVSGGPENGWRLLDDSNLDWGENLRILGKHLEDKDYGKVKFFSHWPGVPSYWGIEFEEPTSDDLFVKPSPGVYVMNVHTLVQGLYIAEQNPRATSDWLRRYEPIDKVGHAYYIYRFE